MSCSSMGPRGPAVATLLLWATGTPAAVVSPFLLIFISRRSLEKMFNFRLISETNVGNICE